MVIWYAEGIIPYGILSKKSFQPLMGVQPLGLLSNG